ncbi:MAG: DUF2380 domain-containing protein [Pseudomonadota bacterium]
MKVRVEKLIARLFLILLCQAGIVNGYCGEKLMLLEFGLDDDTLLPHVEDEKRRVASLAPFVEKGLRSFGHRVVLAETSNEMRAQIANGYLINFPASAIEMAESKNCRWVALGKLRKFSFMESWIRLYLVDVQSGQVVGHAESEVRGHMTDDRMTQRTAFSLAQQIDDFILELREKE